MKVLMYGNRKADPVYFLIDTQERVEKAFARLFKHLDEEWEVYTDLQDPELLTLGDVCEACSKGLCRLCEKPYRCGCAACMGTRRRHGYLSQVEERQQEKVLYDAAKKGDVGAAIKLMHRRRDGEYESYEIVEVQEP